MATGDQVYEACKLIDYQIETFRLISNPLYYFPASEVGNLEELAAPLFNGDVQSPVPGKPALTERSALQPATPTTTGKSRDEPLHNGRPVQSAAVCHTPPPTIEKKPPGTVYITSR